MTSAIPPSCVPQLPAEMWRMVLGNFGTTEEDLIHLWLICRHVSRLFKVEVEHIFATKHVPKTSLWVGNATTIYSHSAAMDETREPWEGTRDDAVFKFQRFAEDGQRAVFRYSPEACLTKEYLDTVFESLRNQDLPRHMLEKPFHVVQVRKQVNDTYLPDLTVDDGEQTVALDWRQLFSPFFAEDKKYYVVKPGTSNLIHENRGFRLEGWYCIDYECLPSVERMCDGCLVATAEDDTEERHLRRRASKVIVRRAYNRDALGTCVDTKRCLRRDRIRNLHRNLLHQDLVIDQQFVLNESAAMWRIDDVRFHALDEDFSEDEESKSNG